MTEHNDIKAIVEIAQDAVKPVPVDLIGDNLLFVPADQNQPSKIHDLEQYLAAPRRKKGNIKVFSVEAFNTVLFNNSGADIVVYVDENALKPSIVAVLNDHGLAGPGWRDFRCALEFRETVQWARWKAIDGKMLSQVAFAEFVEENLNDIFDPVGAEMLEIVTYLQATRTVDFKSALNLSNGQVQFQNIENLEAKVSARAFMIPTEFTLALAPLQGFPVFKIPAKFRYRLVDGKLTMGLKLLRVEDVITQIFTSAMEDIRVGDGVLMVAGSP